MTVFLFFLCHAGTAQAQQTCTVEAASADFGTYNVLLAGANDIVTSFSVSCFFQPPTPVLVTISIGPSPNSGSFDPRQMKLSGGSELLNYNLYIDSGRTQIWGDGTGSTFTLEERVFSQKNNYWTPSVYGRIPPGQDVTIGTYSETLTVTIVW